MKQKTSKVFIVIPTIRNLDFLKAWGNAFSNCNLIVVEDRTEKLVKTSGLKTASISHFNHKDIEKDLGKDSWIISRKNAGIRSYGFLKAYQMGADVIITLDDDCYPEEENFVEKHLDNLSFKASEGWFPIYPDPNWMYTRGFPYSNRDKFPVMISHGLWSGALDLDARTEKGLKKPLNKKPYPPIRIIIPFGYFYPMSSMNLAFKCEVTPLMFFPMMGKAPDGKGWGYDRFDDIWAGIFSKKIMDELKMAVVSGSPFTEHKKASKNQDNLKKEFLGTKVNEILWKQVAKVRLTKKTPKECYLELAKKVKFPKTKYFNNLREAMSVWANLF